MANDAGPMSPGRGGPRNNVFDSWARIAHAELLVATRSAREANVYRSTTADPFSLLTNRTAVLSDFTARAFPARVQTQPVLYPFGGMDLLNAYAAFPNAPAFALMANLPLGWPDAKLCFHSAECAALARASAVGFLRHTHQYELAWTSTEKMAKLFGKRFKLDTGESLVVGILPSLLLCARLMGLDILEVQGIGGVREAPFASGLGGVVVRTSGPRLLYLSVAVPLDHDDSLGWGWRPMPVVNETAAGIALADVQQALRIALGRQPRLTLILKAAPHYINRVPAVARWLLAVSAATLHDETGLTPEAYCTASTSAGGCHVFSSTGALQRNSTSLSAAVWQVRGFGRFVDWTFRERYWYGREEKSALKWLCSGPELPFRWGYAAGASPEKHVGNGVLIASWRQKNTHEVASGTSYGSK